MIHKTEELDGHALEFVVHSILGTFQADAPDLTFPEYVEHCAGQFPLDWSTCGPLIEREGIELWKWSGADGAYWCANVGGRAVAANSACTGDTPLIAAMRALVIAKIGPEVDLPPPTDPTQPPANNPP